MTRAVTRAFVGLWMLLAVAVLAAPALSPAAAQGRNQLPSLAALTLPTITLPLSTTTITTTPPSTSSASTTPTTKPRTATTRHLGTTTTVTIAPTTTTSTTVAPLPAAAPTPVTLPLANAQESGNIGVFFPIMGGIGLFALIALLAAQWFLTKPGRRGPTL